MNKIIIGSVSEEAGKTSLVVGLAKAAGKSFGYLKPFGDRLIYRKKRLWDYDAALVTNIFGLSQSSEDMTIGFEHSKLRYMYDEQGTREKLLEMANKLYDKDVLFVEGGRDLKYGTSVRLDTLALAKLMGGKLVIIVSGDENTIIDEITFVKRYIDMSNIEFAGVIVNKVRNIDDYKNTHLDEMKELGVKVLGVVPFEVEMTYVTVGYLADRLQARVIAGEAGLSRKVKNIFVGAMAADAAVRLPLFRKENKLAITSGDRSDMIVAALENNTVGVVLTNNIIPSQYIISRASDIGTPLLLVPSDTYETAKMIDTMDPLLTKDDTDRVELLKMLIEKNVDFKNIL
jgi:uncharacterized protein